MRFYKIGVISAFVGSGAAILVSIPASLIVAGLIWLTYNTLGAHTTSFVIVWQYVYYTVTAILLITILSTLMSTLLSLRAYAKKRDLALDDVMEAYNKHNLNDDPEWNTWSREEFLKRLSTCRSATRTVEMILEKLY